MYLNCELSVLINGYPLLGINSYDIENDGQHLGSHCDIVLPLAYINNYNQNNTGNLSLTKSGITNSKTGFHIQVKAKYEGYENLVDKSLVDDNGFTTRFDGYIYDIYEGIPATLKCMDAAYLFNLQTIDIGLLPANAPTGFTGTLQDMIEQYLFPVVNSTENLNNGNDTEISFYKGDENYEMPEIDLKAITFLQSTPAAILMHIKKELGLNISLIGRELYVGVASNQLNTVNVKSDVNVKSKDGTTGANLQNISNVLMSIKVRCHYSNKDSTVGFFEIGTSANAISHDCFVYNVEPSLETTTIQTLDGIKSIPVNYLEIANNAKLHFLQSRYNGTIDLYLYPTIGLYWRLVYTDVRYPDRNAIYVILKIKETGNLDGFKQMVTVAYLADTTVEADNIQKSGNNFTQ